MISTIKVFENILFIAKKAGVFEFDLGQLLTDFLGDVQIVADFKDYGGDIFKRFADTMMNLVRRMPNVDKIYIVAHSEGTVVSFKGLLTALAAEKNPSNEWVDKVKGYMTIGSPLNKHIVMWPNLWKGLKPAPGRTRQAPILWRNYYDYGDPVGFDLQITRDWMRENGWLSKNGANEEARFFQFEDDDDCGFTRYPFPGKAHNDYWNDDKVFGDFIDEVVLKKGKAAKPRTIWWTFFVSRVVPYVLCLALLAGGTYILYSTVVTSFFKSAPSHMPVLRDVCGITCLLAGVTLLSRMPRLDKIWPGSLIGAAAFVLGTIGYLTCVSPVTQRTLSSAFWIPNGIIWWFLGIGLVSAGLSKWRPRWGMIPLIGLGGIAACLVLLTLLQSDRSALDRSLWALVLANAGFLYVWWLGALLFDLVYIWHRFICSYRTTKILSTLRAEVPNDLKA
jgi:pimeloyl-ACP methyl ester carboxylesterase